MCELRARLLDEKKPPHEARFEHFLHSSTYSFFQSLIDRFAY